MRSSMTWTGLTAIGLLLGSASVLPAQTTFIDGATSGLASPAETVTFGTEEVTLTSGASVTNQYAAGYGVTFSPNLYYSPGSTTVAPNIDAHNLGNFTGSTTGIDPFDILFSTAQTSVAFALVGENTATFAAYYQGNLVLSSGVVSDTGNTNHTNDFYGFTGTNLFDEIIITPQTAPPSPQHILLDNLELGTAFGSRTPSTPEGSSLAMLALGGLPLVVGFGRKFRRKTA